MFVEGVSLSNTYFYSLNSICCYNSNRNFNSLLSRFMRYSLIIDGWTDEETDGPTKRVKTGSITKIPVLVIVPVFTLLVQNPKVKYFWVSYLRSFWSLECFSFNRRCKTNWWYKKYLSFRIIPIPANFISVFR